MRWKPKAYSLLTVVAGVLGGCADRGVIEDRPRSGSIVVRDAAVIDESGVRTAVPPFVLEKAANPDEAFRWRRLAWLDEHGQIAPGAYETALRQRRENADYWTAKWAEQGEQDGFGSREAGIGPQSWTSRGPSNIGGRTRSLLIHPTNPNILFAGSVSGGIWKSVNGGTTWNVVNDQLPNLAIGSMAFDPQNPLVIYAGTGEGVFNGDAIGGLGIYKSTDGGDTWAVMPATQGWDNVCRIAISPINSNLIFVSKRYGGVLASSNGGATWSTRFGAQGSFFVGFHPTDGSKAVAHIIDYDFTLGDWFHRAIYTTTSGSIWKVSTGSLAAVYGFSSRIELAYSKSNPSIVFAVCGGDGKVHKSTDGGQSFAAVTTNGGTGTSWYCAPIWVDPTNPDVIVAGGGGLVRSTDGGVTLASISAGYINTVDPHPDIQFVTADPGFNGTTNKRVYICTDGSVYRTDDIYTANAGIGWQRLDQTYRTTQFYGAAGDGASGKIYGGTQDNGSLLLQPGTDVATLPFGGDGGFCAIDWVNPNYLYGEYITLNIHRSRDGGASAGYITNGLTDAGVAANFIAPFVLDPNQSSTMIAGGANLWRNTGLRNASVPPWKKIREAGSSNHCAIAVATGDSKTVWVGQNDAKIYKTSDATSTTPTWTTVDDNGGVNPLPDRYPARIMIDPDNKDRVYIAFGGFSPDNLWRTTDGGTTWQDISGEGVTGLPSATIRGLCRHPTRAGWLYVGTEVGIFASRDDGLTWSTSNDGPANVSVDELVFMRGSNTLLAATHGRGLWTAEVMDCPADFDHDGFVTGDDFDAYNASFEAGNVSADFDGDGFVTGDDFDGYTSAFESGC